MVKEVERDEAQGVDAEDEREWEEEVALHGGRRGGEDRNGAVMFDDFNLWRRFTSKPFLRLTFRSHHGTLAAMCAARSNPPRNSHDSEPSRNRHRAREIGPDANEAIRLHEQIEEEALVKMLEQIVQTAEDTLHDPTHRHLVLPALAHRRQRDRIHMIGHEDAMGPAGDAEALPQHAAQHGGQAGIVAVVVLPHALQAGADAELAAGDADGGVEEVEVWELPVHAVVGDVQRLEAVREGVVDGDGALERAGFQG